jgi:hypothetical protein
MEESKERRLPLVRTSSVPFLAAFQLRKVFLLELSKEISTTSMDLQSRSQLRLTKELSTLWLLKCKVLA